jgi:hypothetical protein
MFASPGLQFAPRAFRTTLSGHARSGFPVFWGLKKSA